MDLLEEKLHESQNSEQSSVKCGWQFGVEELEAMVYHLSMCNGNCHVTNFRIKAPIQQYVAGLDIPVNNVWLSLFMKKT